MRNEVKNAGRHLAEKISRRYREEDDNRLMAKADKGAMKAVRAPLRKLHQYPYADR